MAHDFNLKIKTRFTLLLLFCIGAAGAMLCRAAYIQLWGNPRLETMARRQFQSHALIRPRRGSITDRSGEPLAVNVEANSLAANPSKVRNKRNLARLLARSINIPASKLLQKLNEKREFVWIKRHLTQSELRRFKKWKIIDSDGDFMEGLWLVKESERVYPHGSLASHVIGSVNVDSEGIEGIELWFNDHLRGKVASVSAIKDALGRPTFIDAVAAKTIQEGDSVTLSLDASLQFEVEQGLSHAVQRTGARGGTVIVMNASNGEILALANEPSFNLNEKLTRPEKRRNRALTDGFEPGSTFKAILLAGALSNGWKLTDQIWAEKGVLTLQGHKISEAEAHEKFDWLSLKAMIQVSSNVAAAKLALKLGVDRYLKTIRSFGIGSKSGIGFPGEISGKIPGRKEWGPLTLANIGFGQGILVTPIQMTRAYAAILNGGWLVKPTLLKRPEKFDLRGVQTRIISQKVSQDVIEALETVTEEGGTGKKAALSGYRVAGKTGTAQLVDPSTGKYSREKYVASFIGSAVGVDPKIVIFTSLIEPRGVYYASETAAPLFREVLSSVVNRCSLPIQVTATKILADQTIRDKLKLSQASAVSQVDSAPRFQATLTQGSLGWIMPSLKGLTPRETFRLMQNHRFEVRVTGMGVVSSQVPEVGKILVDGDVVRLILSEP